MCTRVRTCLHSSVCSHSALVCIRQCAHVYTLVCIRQCAHTCSSVWARVRTCLHSSVCEHIILWKEITRREIICSRRCQHLLLFCCSKSCPPRVVVTWPAKNHNDKRDFCLGNVKDTDLYSMTTACFQHTVHYKCFRRWSRRPSRWAYGRAPYGEETFCFICLKELRNERLERTICCRVLIHANCLTKETLRPIPFRVSLIRGQTTQCWRKVHVLYPSERTALEENGGTIALWSM